jgi:Uma2 family endonuclease
MNLQTKMPTTADEFLRWNEGREGKREFVRGRVVELMINVTRNHWRLATQLTHQLVTLLGMDEYNIGSADFGVRTRDGVRYPDIMVERFGAGGKELAATAPLFIAEVLSPSSMADDFGPKAADYLALPSLLHYMILSQDEVRVWLWSRDERGTWRGPDMLGSDETTVTLDRLGVNLRLASLYAGIVRDA